ncbi:MAG TPA: WD40 repeat domain-containing protein [Pirellulales bacterium]|jgi:WD40 repeat protein|nr:WD40 repeat domain-containing protein [Pirellulales bacterium]
MLVGFVFERGSRGGSTAQFQAENSLRRRLRRCALGRHITRRQNGWAISHPKDADLSLARFDAVTGRLVRKFPFTKGNLYVIGEVAVAPNQRILAAAVMVNGLPGPPREVLQVRLWNLLSGKELRTIENVKGGVGEFGFSSDGRIMVASQAAFAGIDDGKSWEGLLRVWDLAANKVIFSREQFDAVLHAATISPDGKML